MGKNGALWVGLVFLLIGFFTISNFLNENLSKWLGIKGLFIYFGGYFAFLIGVVIIGAYFKAWIERSTGTRF